MDPIDLRSDTVTLPTPAMREAMANARVGDDVYGEDPTVSELEEVAAQLLGHEAAVYVPSGTMANQVALRSLTHGGEVVLVGESAHILKYEASATTALWGVEIRAIGRGGQFDADAVAAAIPPDDEHFAEVTAIAIENTHNVSGGRVWPQRQLENVCAKARELGLRIHIDGARLLNASIASGVAASEMGRLADSVSLCLSKGLGAPVGSVVAGSAERVRLMRRARKQLGGGMRQAGIIAAAGVFALKNNVARLAEDHAHAAMLAEGLRAMGFGMEAPPDTNIVVFQLAEPLTDAAAFSRSLEEAGIRIDPMGRNQLRAVTNLGINREAIERTLEQVRLILARQ
jgi:threonine aldolase